MHTTTVFDFIYKNKDDKENIYQAKFFCSHIQRKRTCNFAVGFNMCSNDDKQFFHWQKNDTFLLHNHCLNPPAPTYNGKQIKNSVKELTKEEANYARENMW
jgi:hypothetical protein